MKKIILLLLITVISYAGFAQSALADLKFEEAESAFVNEDYQKVLSSLDEFDKIIGSITAKSLYMRIAAMDNLHDYENFDSANLANIKNLNKYTKAYLKSLENETPDDKYKEVYAIDKKITYQQTAFGWRNMPEIKKGELFLKDSTKQKEAFEWFKKAAQKNNPVAMLHIGDMYWDGKLDTANMHTEAFKWFQKAADLNNRSGFYYLALCYQNGVGIEKNEDKAMQFFKKAAEMDLPVALDYLGDYYYNKKNQQGYDEAIKWYKKGAKTGLSASMVSLGLMYDYGRGVPVDYKEALKWYKLAAAKNNVLALNNIGAFYEDGKAVTKDLAEALNYYLKAADKGNYYWAQRNVARFYMKGIGVTKDYNIALKWLLKAERKGDDEFKKSVKESIGECYYEIGTTQYYAKDYGNAMISLKKAFDYGKTYSRTYIMYMYADGLGVPKDKKLAKEWKIKTPPTSLN